MFRKTMTLAKMQHLINWWGSGINLTLLDKVLEAKKTYTPKKQKHLSIQKPRNHGK
jgi:hypothetical protein